MLMLMHRYVTQGVIYKIIDNYVLLHKSDISQLSSESFNQMIDMVSKLFIVDPETTY
jgi:hypothetical protein